MPIVWLWGFTVDDALISARVAYQLASGHGYRFNASGPIVDAVTPLGWAPLLSFFAKSGPIAAFDAARALGLGAWLLSAAWLGARIATLGWRALAVTALFLLATTPLAAWSIAGMETGLVLALATFGLSRHPLGAMARGVAAALRPELLPWALALSLGLGFGSEGSVERRLLRSLPAAAVALTPFLVVAVVRRLLFGVPYPIALEAKPPYLPAGLRYVAEALLLTGPPWLALSARAWPRVSRRGRAIAVAVLVHALSLVLAGGDWMPLYRLFVPVLPGLIWIGAELAAESSLPATVARAVLGLVACGLVAVVRGPSARKVWQQRRALIAQARPLLARAEHVATLDVGWVGVATRAEIVDLAGVTDPRVARLPGGHTTKRLPESFLEARAVDALVILAQRPQLEDWPALTVMRGVEVRLLTLAGADAFRPAAKLPLLGTDQAYVIALKRPPSQAD